MEIFFIWFFRSVNLILSIGLTWKAITSFKNCGYQKCKDFSVKVFAIATGIYWSILSCYLVISLFYNNYPMLNNPDDELVRGGISLLLVMSLMFSNHFSRG
jgi:hypothetical protein